jgi:hypothetical protein
MMFQGAYDSAQAIMPAYPFRLSIIRIADLLLEGDSECVLHEETVFVHDVSEATIIAIGLLKLYGGDGFSIRRSEEDLRV